jgi:hypothetical protein
MEPPHPRDGVGTAAQESSDLCHRTAGVGAQDDQAIAEDIGRGRGEAQLIEGVPFLVGEGERLPLESLLTGPGDSRQGGKPAAAGLMTRFAFPPSKGGGEGLLPPRCRTSDQQGSWGDRSHSLLFGDLL